MTPPPELLKQWEDDWFQEEEHADVLLVNAYAAGAQAGADQELEACCEWMKLEGHEHEHAELRAARRPQPQTLNSIAMQMLGTIECDGHYIPEITDTIRRALESLPNEAGT
jgi:hypothetical protein